MTHAPRLAVFPGTFDPFTNGHLDIVTRSSHIFDQVLVAVLVNADKRPMLSVDDRLALIVEATAAIPGVGVESFEGLLVEFARRHRAVAIVRGLRGASDFDEERQLALMNRHLEPDIETIFLTPSAECAHVSSSRVREIAALGGPLSGLVPPGVAAFLDRRRRSHLESRA